MKKHITKPKNVKYRVVPRPVWRIAKQHLPKQAAKARRVRKPHTSLQMELTSCYHPDGLPLSGRITIHSTWR